MSREKQIEEMAKDVAMSITWCDEEILTIDCLETATLLYDKGYRKQSVGEWLASDVLRGDEDWKRYACSLCKHMTDAYYKDVRDLSKFCPNCGAKMKGENNE